MTNLDFYQRLPDLQGSVTEATKPIPVADPLDVEVLLRRARARLRPRRRRTVQERPQPRNERNHLVREPAHDEPIERLERVGRGVRDESVGEAEKVMSISVRDRPILTDHRHTSFAERGLM